MFLVVIFLKIDSVCLLSIQQRWQTRTYFFNH